MIVPRRIVYHLSPIGPPEREHRQFGAGESAPGVRAPKRAEKIRQIWRGRRDHAFFFWRDRRLGQFSEFKEEVQEIRDPEVVSESW